MQIPVMRVRDARLIALSDPLASFALTRSSRRRNTSGNERNDAAVEAKGFDVFSF